MDLLHPGTFQKIIRLQFINRRSIKYQAGRSPFNWCLLKNLKIEKIIIRDSKDIDKIRSDFEIYVDAIFGVGVHGTLRQPYNAVINKLNEINGIKVSIDVASPNLISNVVISLHCPKKDSTALVDIGIPNEFDYFYWPRVCQ